MNNLIKDDKMKTRSPIVSVLGHVDHGKTSLLDFIRGSAIATKEAGGITQHIGATYIPMAAIKELGGNYLNKLSISSTVEGLFFIDTPGHKAFTTLRKRGGALADLAILMVDINEGFKPQTYEALNILKLYKTPFIVVANKIDKLFGWEVNENESFIETFNKQAPSVQNNLDMKLYELVGVLHKEGFNSERFDRVTDFASQISIVPISATTGEGFAEVLAMLMGLAQQYLLKQLEIDESEPGKCTVLEVKEEPGFGVTVDAVIYDGIIKKNDQIAILTDNDVIFTKIRSLLEPNPLEEMKTSKYKFNKVDSVVAAGGIKIVAPHLENILSGSPLKVVRGNKKEVKEELLNELKEIDIQTDDDGIMVKADTLGSLEALVNILRENDIPVEAASIGDLSRRDVVDASILKEKNPEHGVIIAFNVKVLSSAKQLLKEKGIKLFEGNVIYQITEEYQNWLKEAEEAKKKLWLESIIRPAKIRIIPKLIFRQSKPAIAGIEVLSGSVKKGYRLMDSNTNYIGTIESMQHDGDNIPVSDRGDKVAMAIKDAVANKNFEEDDVLYVDIPEKHFKILQRELKDKLTDDEFETLNEIIDIKRKFDPEWGKLGLFEFN